MEDWDEIKVWRNGRRGKLIDLVRCVNGRVSAATGDFLGRALAVEGKAARLQLLNRGQNRVASKISEALPHVEHRYSVIRQ